MDRDYLEKERENLLTQQRQHLALYHQASGAVAVLDSLISKMDNDSALDQVKKATGADSAEIVKINRKGKGDAEKKG